MCGSDFFRTKYTRLIKLLSPFVHLWLWKEPFTENANDVIRSLFLCWLCALVQIYHRLWGCLKCKIMLISNHFLPLFCLQLPTADMCTDCKMFFGDVQKILMDPSIQVGIYKYWSHFTSHNRSSCFIISLHLECSTRIYTSIGGKKTHRKKKKQGCFKKEVNCYWCSLVSAKRHYLRC